MFCQYDTLREWSLGRFSTFWLACEKPRLAGQKSNRNNADVVSACNSLLRLARMASPRLELLGPDLRHPVPRPKLAFTWMANFLKGIAVVHRQQTVVLFDVCNVLVKNIFDGMMEPDTVYIFELDDGDNDPPKKRRRLRTIKPAKVAPIVDMSGEPSLEKLNIDNARAYRSVTMVEHNTPRPQPETFGNVPYFPPCPYLSPEAIRAVVEARATRSFSQQSQVSSQQSVAGVASNVEGGPGPLDLSLRSQEVRLAERVPPAEELRPAQGSGSTNTSSITLLSGQKRKRAAAPRRRHVEMKVFVKSLSKMQQFSSCPNYLMTIQASASWKDGLYAEPYKSVPEILNTPYLPMSDPLAMNLFSLDRLRDETGLRDGFGRSGTVTPPKVSFQSSLFPGSEASAPNVGRDQGSVATNPWMVSGVQPLNKTGVSNGSWNNSAGESVLQQQAAGRADISEHPATQEQGVKRRASQEDESDAKRGRLNESQTSIVSPGRPWDRVLLKNQISKLWSEKGTPISFYDLCPKKTSSVKIATRVLSALLDLHLKKEVVLEQENTVMCTPIQVHMPGTHP